MIEKLALKELVLKPAGTLADGAAVDDGAVDDGAVDAEDGAVVAVVVAEVLFELLLQAAVSPARPNTATPRSIRRGRRWLRTESIHTLSVSSQHDCSPLKPAQWWLADHLRESTLPKPESKVIFRKLTGTGLGVASAADQACG